MPKSRRVQSSATCDICGKIISRKSDMSRHMLTHAPDKEEKMHKCSKCSYASLQLSNLKTHMRIHTGERPFKCPSCPKDFSDPAIFSRHRQLLHGYVPKSGRTTRRKARSAPYTKPTLTDRSLSTLSDDSKDGSKDNSAAYNTELNQKFPELNDAYFALDPLSAAAPPTNCELPAPLDPSGSGNARLPTPDKKTTFDVDGSAWPPGFDKAYSDALLDDFLARYGECKPPVPASPTPTVPSILDNVFLPSATDLPTYNPAPPPPLSLTPDSLMQYFANNMLLHPAPLPTYPLNGTSYGYIGHGVQPASLGAQYHWPQFTIPPALGQTAYPPTQGTNALYPHDGHTFPMQGLNPS